MNDEATIPYKNIIEQVTLGIRCINAPRSLATGLLRSFQRAGFPVCAGPCGNHTLCSSYSSPASITSLVERER
ncbi:hypothetical protein HPB48_022639 [Haemaphysalis longicornis]|uniref:Uncharacterized protein n=1 Tax=Haemaphysalis longicornis TaxID=44386 RepID=A0A9J6GYB7_HAELO|nr:hypothetical protein HPB48_022639 [Haemaphysalis longicornis]